MFRRSIFVLSLSLLFLFIVGVVVVGAGELSAPATETTVAQASYTTIITVTTAADPDDDQQYVCYTEGLTGKTPRLPCTLRQALEESHTLDSGAGPILIRFDLPAGESHDGTGTDYWVVQLAETGELNALPDVGNQTTIDGSTQPGGRSDGPKIILHGPENVPEGYALVLEEGSTVRGLAFQKFRMHIQINGSDNTVEDSWFGLTDDGLDVVLRDEERPEDGSGQSGITTADNNTNNTVQNNVLTHFRGVAISVRGDSSFVMSNTVGTLADGTVPYVREDRRCKANAFELNWFSGAGIDISGHDNLVQNNRVVGMLYRSEDPFTTPDNAFDISGTDHVVRDNIVGMASDGVAFGTCGSGMELGGIMGAHTIEVRDNTIVGARGVAGIHVTGGPYGYDVDAVTVQGNIIKESANEAFKFGDTLPSELRDFEPAAITSIDGFNVSGTSGAGSPCAGCTVELFLDNHDTVSETLESLTVVTADGSGNWNATLGRTLALTEGIRTASTTAADGQIPHPSAPSYVYHAGMTTKLSDIYVQAGAPEPTPPADPEPLPPLYIPPISYAPPPTLPLTYPANPTTIITVTTVADPDDNQSYVCYNGSGGVLGTKVNRLPCTLRQAVEEAEELGKAYSYGTIPNPYPIVISFDIPAGESYEGAGEYWVIELAETGQLNALPYLSSNTAIVGSTQPGGRSDGPKVIVRGPEKVPSGYGLVVDSDSLISGLGFQRLRMHLQLNGGGNIIIDNWFGLTDDGQDIYLRDEEHPEDGSGQSGITTVENVSGNLIQDNVLAGFRGGAVGLRSNDSFLWGNYIGVNAGGLVPVDVPASRWCKPNARYHNWFGGAGVDVSGKRCQIGGDTADKGNIIAAMLIYGDDPAATQAVALNLNRQDHLVQNNIIGMDLSGKEVGTCGDGIVIDAPRTRVVANIVARSAALSMFSTGTRTNSNSRAMWGNVILDTAPKTGEFEPMFDFGAGIPEELALFMPTQVVTFEVDGVTVHGSNADENAACPYCGVELFADDLDGISEMLESLATATTDVDGNWTATLSRPLLITEGLRTAVTAMNYGTIPNYDANTTSRFSDIYRPAGAQDITPPTPTVEEPLPIPEPVYSPPPTLPHAFAYNTIITVTTGADPDDNQMYVCYDDSLPTKVTRSPCTLRQAIQESKSLADNYRTDAFPILIRFAISTTDGTYDPTGGYWTIVLTETGQLNALPYMGGMTALDGATQPDYGGLRPDQPRIIIRGPEKVPNGYGLVIADDSLVRGIAFQRLRMHMYVSGSGNIIEDTWFGLSDEGLDIVLRDLEHPEDGSGQSGIIVAENGTRNLIQNNVLAGFRGGAVSLGSNDSYFRGNYVGVNVDGEIPVDITYNRVCKPNARYYNWFGGAGVDVHGHRNVIGGPDAADGNIFASMLIRGEDPFATPPDALAIHGGDHLVQNNLIGVDAAGQDAGVCGIGLRLNADYTHYISNTISQSGIYALYQAGNRYDSNARTLQGNLVWDSDTLLEFDPGIPEPFQVFTPSRITSIVVGGGDTTVSGANGDSNAPCPYCQVEIFTDDLDDTPELLESVAMVTADAAGNWTVTLGRELAITEGLRTMVTAWDYGVIEDYYEAGSTSRYSELYTQSGSTPPDPEPDPTPVPPRDAPETTYEAPPGEPVSYAMVVTVTTTANTSGTTCGATCSLRQAIGAVSAYGAPRPALIAFDIPTSDAGYDGTLGVWKIELNSTTTVEDGQVTLDATTQPGYDGSRPVIIVWRNGTTGIDLKLGQTALDDGYVVRGLALQGVGLLLNGDGNIVSDNWLGLSDDGSDIYYYSDNPNNDNHAIIYGSSGSGHHYIHHNVLAGSGTVALDFEGDDNLIEANRIGTRGDGTIDVAAIPEANICDPTATTDNWLGGGGIDIAGYRNRILDNVIAGLLIKGSATSTPPDAIDLGYGEYNLVAGNRIGVDASGAEVWTCGDGISDEGSDFTRVLSNTIINSFGHGIYMDGNYWDTNANTLQGNVISNCIGPITFGDMVPNELDLFHPGLVTLIDGVNVTGISDDDCPYCYVDVYLDDDDPYVEALAYWGTVQADGSGDWDFILPRELTENEGLRTISTAHNYGVIRNYEIGSSSKLSVLFTEQPPTAVASVALTPPTGDLWTGSDVYFVANVSPANATLPISYTWTATGLPDQVVRGGVEKAVTFNWDTPGTKTVQVTALNAYGSAIASVQVTVQLWQAPTAVDIDGPTAGYTGTICAFAADVTPDTATMPIVYTWEPAPASGQGTADVTYLWMITGTHVITVTAENVAGAVADTHSIEILAMPDVCTQPVTGASISGPASGDADTDYTFTASVTPNDATEPLFYTWSPAPDSGQGTESATYRWATGGAKIISLSVSNCGGTVNTQHSILIAGGVGVSVYLPLVLRATQ